MRIDTVEQHADIFQSISVKGDPAWDILEALGRDIETTPLATSMTGLQYKAPRGWLLTGIDESQETLAMWHAAYIVFLVAKKTKYPTPEQISTFPKDCFVAFLTFRARASRQRFLPDYLHITYFHGPDQLKHFGSLDLLCNQDTEAANKTMLRIYAKSQHQGSVGRISQGKREKEEASGIPVDHTYGRSNQNEGLRGLLETVTVKTSVQLAPYMNAMRVAAHGPDDHPDSPHDSPGQSPPAQRALSPSSTDDTSRGSVATPEQLFSNDASPMSCASPPADAGTKHSAPNTTSSSKRAAPPKRHKQGNQVSGTGSQDAGSHPVARPARARSLWSAFSSAQ